MEVCDVQWIIPGTVLEANRAQAEQIPEQFRAMFLGGGMMLSQVSAITGLEPYQVQNWVRRGFLTPPDKKRYTIRQLCRIININMLKGVLPIEKVCSLLGYINGQLDDESDDIIDDSKLYFMFVALAARVKELYNPEMAQQLLEQCLQDYEEPHPGAKERVKKALRIMLTAYLAERMRQEAEKMLLNLKENEL